MFNVAAVPYRVQQQNSSVFSPTGWKTSILYVTNSVTYTTDVKPIVYTVSSLWWWVCIIKKYCDKEIPLCHKENVSVGLRPVNKKEEEEVCLAVTET
jgi:hypothetical protein